MSKIKVTIDRARWRTGCNACPKSENQTGRGLTRLKNEEGFQCCLGFVSESYMISAGEPVDLGSGTNFWPQSLRRNIADLVYYDKVKKIFVDSDLSLKAMKINDEASTTPREKETLLLKLFKDSSYELEFIGEYTKE